MLKRLKCINLIDVKNEHMLEIWDLVFHAYYAMHYEYDIYMHLLNTQMRHH